ncbi:glycosyltransferase family 4 protein [Larkinella soli]|uniref:glycosyltransferase family 4 protein n=1 Tax=Larkinella soli TaxID=1770527 RepID=UPI000FFBCB2C|nr:glycosyltransferase family 1 protein [Larkinella soli]
MTQPVIVNTRFLSQPVTGMQRVAIEFCRQLKARLPDVRFVAPHNIMHPELAAELAVEIVGRRKGILWEQFDFLRYLRRLGNPPAVNLCNTAPLGYRKQLVMVHDLSFRLHPEWFSAKLRALYGFMVPRAARAAAKLLTVSRYSAETLRAEYRLPADSVEVIYPGVSDAFRTAPAVAGPNPYGRFILAVSSLDPRKNFRGLIAAFHAARLPEVKLVIVGAAHSIFRDPQLNELVRENPSLIFTGYLSDTELINLYRHALFFAYPSFFEGFGLPPLEAMACGCPTLVSDTTSLPEVCGDASLYVNPADTDSIRAGLERLYTDPELRKRLITKGFERVRQFDWNEAGRQLTTLVREMAES